MNVYAIVLVLSLFVNSYSDAKPFPISFAISESKIVSEIPEKDKDFASLVPGEMRTYTFNDEDHYYQDYRRSYYAFTWKKGGWDCLRHYEILANGCIPYFTDLDACPADTMHLFPKELIKEAMQLEGVGNGWIDHSKFDRKRYFEILEELLEHTRNHLSARAIAQYVLDTVHYSGNGKILFLSMDPNPDYLKTCLLIGLKELVQDKVIDFPKNDYVNVTYPGNTRSLYGKGFTYTKVVEDYPVNRDNLEARIKNREFELIMYPHVHFGCLFHDLVQQYYKPEEIIYMCGQDAHACPYGHLTNFFLREYDAYRS